MIVVVEHITGFMLCLFSFLFPKCIHMKNFWVSFFLKWPCSSCTSSYKFLLFWYFHACQLIHLQHEPSFAVLHNDLYYGYSAIIYLNYWSLNMIFDPLSSQEHSCWFCQCSGLLHLRACKWKAINLPLLCNIAFFQYLM